MWFQISTGTSEAAAMRELSRFEPCTVPGSCDSWVAEGFYPSPQPSLAPKGHCQVISPVRRTLVAEQAQESRRCAFHWFRRRVVDAHDQLVHRCGGIGPVYGIESNDPCESLAGIMNVARNRLNEGPTEQSACVRRNRATAMSMAAI